MKMEKNYLELNSMNEKSPVIVVEGKTDIAKLEKITNAIEFPNILNQGDMMVKKPVIYLYPTKDTKVDVKLVNDNLLTCTYPKYQDKWSVLAKPNGDLMYLETGRSLYSLYYEADSLINFTVTDEGFVVKGKDSAKFLEEKLEILGLNEHEGSSIALPKVLQNLEIPYGIDSSVLSGQD